MAIEIAELGTGLTKIAESVLRQCNDGAQSKDLGSENYRACGQFYGPKVLDRKQLGLHGMAAAVTILHASRVQNAETTAHHVASFCESLFSDPSQSKVDPDDLKNILKISELLSALSGSDQDKSFADMLHKLLNDNRNPSDGGWGFYTDESISNEVPTAYALVALAPRVPLGDLLTTRKFLWDRYVELSKKPEVSDIGSTGRRVLILYALASYFNHEDKTAQDKAVSSEVRKLWRELSEAYKTPFEMTEEYHRGDKNHYVRIPWQVYLAHALIQVDSRYYYSVRFQKFFESLHRSALADGYCYPHSGSLLSTRTNSAVAQLISSAISKKPSKNFAFAIFDGVREGLSISWIRYPLVIALAIVILRVTDYYKQQAADHNPLWIEVIGNGLNLFLIWLATTRRGKS